MNSPSLSHSYISNSVVTNSSTSSTTNNNNNNNNNGYTRERSNTKSNHVQFLKLNERQQHAALFCFKLIEMFFKLKNCQNSANFII